MLLPLQQAGHLIWIDRTQGGDGWNGALLDAIWSCDAVVFVVSPHSATSEKVRREVHVAAAEGVPIIPIVIEAAKLPPDLAWYLTLQRPLDARFDLDTTMVELLRAVDNTRRRMIARPRRFAARCVALALVAVVTLALWLLL